MLLPGSIAERKAKENASLHKRCCGLDVHEKMAARRAMSKLCHVGGLAGAVRLLKQLPGDAGVMENKGVYDWSGHPKIAYHEHLTRTLSRREAGQDGDYDPAPPLR